MNPYQVLGVSFNDDDETIKKAYRKAVKTCHPDTHPGDKAAEEKFKNLATAYDILSNKEKRKKYDEEVTVNKTEKKAPKQQKGGYASIRPEDLMKEFEQFFSPDGKSVKGSSANGKSMDGSSINGAGQKSAENKKTNPMDVSSLFEKYMGFKS